MTTIPSQLQYNTLKPAGFATKYKQIKFTPTAALNAYQYNDTVRFFIQTPGFWDPYNCYIKMTVQYNDTTQPGVALQLDGSAQSLIDQLLITTNSQELERIEQYDTISQVLRDMNVTEDLKSTLLHEGISAGNRNNFRGPQQSTSQNQAAPWQQGGTVIQPPNGMAQSWKNSFDAQGYQDFFQSSSGIAATTGFSGIAYGWTPDATLNINAPSIVGSVLFNPNKKRHLVPRLNRYWSVDNAGLTGGYNTIDGNKGKYLNKYIALLCQQEPLQDSTFHSGATNVKGPNGQLPFTTSANELQTQRRTYGLYTSNQTANVWLSSQNKWALEIGRCELPLILDNFWQDIQHVNGYAIDQAFLDESAAFYASTESNFLKPQFMGFQFSYSAALSTGFEAFLSSSLPQTNLYNGKIQNIPTVYNTKTFSFPLMSALFGALMPRESYRYIPMDFLQNLIFEFRLSPYAFFTSGNIALTGTSQFTTAEQPSVRNWTILNMEIDADIYFFDEVIQAQVNAQANGSGIFLHTSSWFLGPQYPISNTQAAIGTYQINMGFESLKIIMMIALDASYTSYPYCRKQFRLSHNVTSWQLKFGTEYYPPQPITGHAGCPMGSNNNADFYFMLQKAFGKLNDIWGDMGVNPVNFAVTERPYDPSATGPFLTSALEINALTSGDNVGVMANYTLNPASINTQRGMPFFHENRCIGKCIYAMNLEGFPSNDKIISGLDTTKIRPFEVMINCDSANGTQRASTIMFFLYADIFYVIKPGTVQIFGK